MEIKGMKVIEKPVDFASQALERSRPVIRSGGSVLLGSHGQFGSGFGHGFSP
jgi:hypothetical protein